MALTITFAIGAPCAGGEHFPVTVDPTPGAAIPLTRDRKTWRQALDADERERFAEYLVRLLVGQLAGQSAAQIKAVLEATTIDLSVTG